MSAEPLTDQFAQSMRRSWFAYLDVVEPIRPELHRYCLKLTGELWSAEDLVQDTLLRGFGGLGRGDLHGPGSAVRSAKAWLFRVASNLWIDAARRTARAGRASGPRWRADRRSLQGDAWRAAADQRDAAR
jgi:RNA polymerase sigma-70 factor (ECF subfamily)